VFLYPELAITLVTKSDQCEAIASNAITIIIIIIYVGIEASNKWLTNADLFTETEGFLTAIQDQVILKRNYKKYILKQPDTEEPCRICGKESETVQHITAACEKLAPTDYVKRHDGLTKLSIRNWQKQPN